MAITQHKPESGSELRSPQSSSWMELGSIFRPGLDLCWDSSTISVTIWRISLINMIVCKRDKKLTQNTYHITLNSIQYPKIFTTIQQGF